MISPIWSIQKTSKPILKLVATVIDGQVFERMLAFDVRIQLYEKFKTGFKTPVKKGIHI